MKATTAVIWATIYLIGLYVIPNYSSSLILTGILYLSFPAIFISMIIIVLKDDSIKPKELNNEEWGYADKNKDELWVM